jgi:putative transposase
MMLRRVAEWPQEWPRHRGEGSRDACVTGGTGRGGNGLPAVDEASGDACHYDEKNPPSAAAAQPLRELIDDRLLDALLERSKDEAGGLRLTGEGPMPGELVRAVLERALGAGLTARLGYDRHDPAGDNSGNSRNGTIAKTVQTGVGPVALQVPRDRAGTFDPVLVPKRSGRVSGGLDDMIISLYAHGMSVRDILHHLDQVYGTRLSAETVSRITDGVLEEVRGWQSRPLDPVWAVVFLDAIVVKVRDNHVVHNKPAYLAIGIDTDGEKHVRASGWPAPPWTRPRPGKAPGSGARS